MLNEFKEFLKRNKEEHTHAGMVFFQAKEEAIQKFIDFLEQWEEKTYTAEMCADNYHLQRNKDVIEGFINYELKKKISNVVFSLDLPMTAYPDAYEQLTAYRTKVVLLFEKSWNKNIFEPNGKYDYYCEDDEDEKI